MLKRNLFANYVGQAWVAIMSIAFVPIYIKYLGIESYGLIGLFAVMQSWLGLLDMGLAPTLSREMSKFLGGSHSLNSIRDLLRSVEVIAFLIAVLITVGLLMSSSWLAGSWLNLESLSAKEVVVTFYIMSLVIALRFIEGLYKSCIIGLQRQVLLNVLNCLLITIRSVGAIFILTKVSQSITAFFYWQALISLLAVALYGFYTYESIPEGSRSGKFSSKSLKGIKKFAGGMFFITLLSLLLTQTDKVILSRILALTEYGYYMLASSVAGAIYMAIYPIGQIWFPRMTEKHSNKDFNGLEILYHQGCQLVSVVMGSTAILLIFFSDQIIFLWTQNADLTDSSSSLVSILVFGNLLNGLMWIPYQAQLAYGWTTLTSRINMIGVLLIIPLLFWIVPEYGAIGAAWIWVSLNLGYVVIGINFMFKKILKAARWHWYFSDTLIPLLVSTLIAFFLHNIYLSNVQTDNIYFQLFFISIIFIIILISSGLSAGYVRSSAFKFYASVVKV